MRPFHLEREERRAQKIVLPGQTPEGQYILSILVKRSYKIISGKQCIRADVDQKLISGDIHYRDPMNSSVKFETDYIPFKIATDVVLNGKAYAPKGKPVEVIDVSLTIGPYRKELRVFGDRVCRYREKGDPLFTDPIPFETMEICYERAYGGVDIYSNPDMPCAYARNHLGRGFAISNNRKVIENLPLPNIEDPKDLLTPERICIGHFMYWERQPIPQGFGWFSKYWQPRASYAGVMPADRKIEEELRKAYTKLIPPEQMDLYERTQLRDMDFRFFNGASPGLALPFLTGEEEVHLINLSPEGELSFRLPGDRPIIGLDIGMGLYEPEAFLHTVMIRLEDREVDMVWRGAVPYPGPDWLPQMRKMEVWIQ